MAKRSIDLGDVFESPPWSGVEIEFVTSFIKNILQSIPVEYESKDTGIFVGTKNESVKIEKKYADNKGVEVDIPAEGRFKGKPFRFNDGKAREFKGKLYERYALVVSNSCIPVNFKTMREIADAAVVAYSSMIFTKDELQQPVNPVAQKEFSL